MRLVVISDTHGKHDEVKLPEGDVLIHCGDFMSSGRNVVEIVQFNIWLNSQPHRHKIVIAGNHDVLFEQSALSKLYINRAYYLEDSGIEIEGVRFWGSPYTPAFNNWAFNEPQGEAIKRHWDLIPEDTDVLITHGPAFGRLDNIYPGEPHLGCEELKVRIDKIKPMVHLFGHIHGSYGRASYDQTWLVNAALCNERYQISNDPIVVDLP